jgi:hypothetical protein
MAEVSFIGADALVERALDAVEVAVNESAEHLVGAAMAATPVKTGTLRGSLHTDGAERGGDSVTARVETGGESSAYSAIVHEGHRADGSYQRKAGPAKFLERPLLENRPLYIEAMRRAAASAF